MSSTKKRGVLIGVTVIIILTVALIIAYSNSSKADIFVGANGEKITVYTKRSIPGRGSEKIKESEDIKAGDIIEFGNSKEIVIGVSEDGRYITMPLEDYQNENGTK